MRFRTGSGINGTERMRITNIGDIGIGTASPIIQLALSDPGVGFERTAVNELGLFTSGAVRLTILPDGKIGIGTNAPTLHNLHLIGTSNNAMKIETTSFECDIDFTRTMNGGTSWQVGTGSTNVDTDVDSFYLFQNNIFRFNFTTAGFLTMPSTGKIGLGIRVPDTKIHTIGLPGLKVALLDNTGNGPGVAPITLANSYLQLGGREFGTGTNRLITFGFVKPGDTLPVAYIGFEEREPGGTTTGDLIFGGKKKGDLAALDVPVERLRITNEGLVGITTIDPKSNLHVNGSVSIKERTVSGTIATRADDYTLLADTASGVVSIEIRSADTTSGRILVIKDKPDSLNGNNVTITTEGVEKINGSTDYSLDFYQESVTIQSDGTNWHVISTAFNETTTVRTLSGGANTSQKNDYFLLALTTEGVITYTLQTADKARGRILIIKDQENNAATNNITIDTQGSEKIDGVDTATINANFGSVRLFSDGSNWFEW